jgi:hypothetical protein
MVAGALRPRPAPGEQCAAASRFRKPGNTNDGANGGAPVRLIRPAGLTLMMLPAADVVELPAIGISDTNESESGPSSSR